MGTNRSFKRKFIIQNMTSEVFLCFENLNRLVKDPKSDEGGKPIKFQDIAYFKYHKSDGNGEFIHYSIIVIFHSFQFMKKVLNAREYLSVSKNCVTITYLLTAKAIRRELMTLLRGRLSQRESLCPPCTFPVLLTPSQISLFLITQLQLFDAHSSFYEQGF